MKTWRCHPCSWTKPARLDLGSRSTSTTKGVGDLGAETTGQLGNTPSPSTFDYVGEGDRLM